jgi:L-threonylcarbamoyladenylate synthase
MTEILGTDHDSLAKAAACLREGGLVAFPTETVYGLGANALDGCAVARIFSAKGRPQFNPLIIHVPIAAKAFEYIESSKLAEDLADRFWPGPLTVILPRRKECAVSELVSAGLPTLAVRVPAEPVARDFLEMAGVPVAAPSANRSGTVSPTSYLHVEQSLGDNVDMILAGSSCEIGLESTVIDLTGSKPAILRPGAVTSENLEYVLGIKPEYDPGNHEIPRSPGQILKHYAPNADLRPEASYPGKGEAFLAFGQIKNGEDLSALSAEGKFLNLSEKGDLTEAAANLFRMLRQLDNTGCERIAVMPVPEKGLGVAINDRLRRAASKN